jgi:WD40 repeat protein
VWDANSSGSLLDQISSPWMQLRHISFADDNKMPERADENHFISSIQWSHSGDKLLTSAYDNIARVWSMQGKLEGLFRS